MGDITRKGIPEAPIDGKQYARRDKAWDEVTVGSDVLSVFGRTGNVVAQTDDYSHTQLSDKGVKTHKNIDDHIDSTSNPHSVTAAQAGAVGLTGDETIEGEKTFDEPPLCSTAPTDAGHLVNKNYADGIAAGFVAKAACRCATVSAKILATDFEQGDIIDEVELVEGDRVLIKNQVDATENGIYTVEILGAPTRATDYDSNEEIKAGTFTLILEGSSENKEKAFVQTTVDPVLDVDDLIFSRFLPPFQYSGGDGIDVIGTTISVKAEGVTNAMLAGSITDAKLNKIDTAGKLSGKAFTELANTPSGAGIIPIANLASGTPDGSKYIRDDGVLASVTGTGFRDISYYRRANNYYSSPETGTALTTGSPTANNLRAIPFIVTKSFDIDRIAIYVSTVAVGNARLGIYRDDGTLYPGTLLLDAGTVSTGTIGTKEIIINQGLNENTLYWLVIVSNTASAGLRCFQVASLVPILGRTSALATANTFGYVRAFTYDVLPATFPSGASYITAVPIPAIFVRRKAA